MNPPEMNNETLFSFNTYECAPVYSNESLFFNLILNTNFENTKENCLIFLKNYSKHIILSKRDLFKNIINELTLSQISNKEINNNNDESIYLIRTCINKYSRNNIINALFDFISQNDNITDNININSSNTTNDISSIEKIENVVKDAEHKENIIPSEDISVTHYKKEKKKKNNLLKKKRKRPIEENIPKENKRKYSSNENNNINEYEFNANNINNMDNMNNMNNIKKEKIDEEYDINSLSNSVKIKQEKDDFFKRSFDFEEKDQYKTKLRLRNRSLSKCLPKKEEQLPIISPKNISLSSGKRRKFGRKKNNSGNKEKILNERNMRSHMIKLNGIVVSYNISKCDSDDNNKIMFYCNNDGCKGKGIYLIDKNIFKETEKHNMKNIKHVIGAKNKNIEKQLIKDKTCDGCQILRNDKFIKDKKVIYLK